MHSIQGEAAPVLNRAGYLCILPFKFSCPSGVNSTSQSGSISKLSNGAFNSCIHILDKYIEQKGAWNELWGTPLKLMPQNLILDFLTLLIFVSPSAWHILRQTVNTNALSNLLPVWNGLLLSLVWQMRKYSTNCRGCSCSAYRILIRCICHHDWLPSHCCCKCIQVHSNSSMLID